MIEKFEEWAPSARSLRLLGLINQVLAEYEVQGYRLTLRQLYYQLVARDVIPNNVRSYHAIGDLVSRGRMAGLIDWERIEDRVRVPRSNTHWESEAQIVEAAAHGFYIDRWAKQKNHVELWCEKDAVSNILQPVCHKLDVMFMANRGYGSQTALYEASLRFNDAAAQGKTCWLLYFGDHDPSGLDMTRDVQDRLNLFGAGADLGVEVQRIALNMPQVDQYHPPKNPAKQTDSRYEGYVREWGESSWELDALEPRVLSDLARVAIMEHLDQSAFAAAGRREQNGKAKIRALLPVLGGVA